MRIYHEAEETRLSINNYGLCNANGILANYMFLTKILRVSETENIKTEQRKLVTELWKWILREVGKYSVQFRNS